MYSTLGFRIVSGIREAISTMLELTGSFMLELTATSLSGGTTLRTI